MNLATLPDELGFEVVSYLSQKDLKSVSLVAWSQRELVTPTLFRNVKFPGAGEDLLAEKLDALQKAREDVKRSIKWLRFPCSARLILMISPSGASQ